MVSIFHEEYLTNISQYEHVKKVDEISVKLWEYLIHIKLGEYPYVSK